MKLSKVPLPATQTKHIVIFHCFPALNNLICFKIGVGISHHEQSPITEVLRKTIFSILSSLISTSIIFECRLPCAGADLNYHQIRSLSFVDNILLSVNNGDVTDFNLG